MTMNYSSKKLSRRINDLIDEFITSDGPDPLNLRSLANEQRVLPLVWDMGGVFGINADGDVISFSFNVDTKNIVAFPLDRTAQPRIESDLRIRNNVLFGGSKKYPELEGLIERPKDVRICPDCGGTGINSYAQKLNEESIVCYCGGLGWIPHES
jgi:hypothetical protein